MPRYRVTLEELERITMHRVLYVDAPDAEAVHDLVHDAESLEELAHEYDPDETGPASENWSAHDAEPITIVQIEEVRHA